MEVKPLRLPEGIPVVTGATRKTRHSAIDLIGCIAQSVQSAIQSNQPHFVHAARPDIETDGEIFGFCVTAYDKDIVLPPGTPQIVCYPDGRVAMRSQPGGGLVLKSVESETQPRRICACLPSDEEQCLKDAGAPCVMRKQIFEQLAKGDTVVIRHPSAFILGDTVARDCAEPPIPPVVYSPDFLARKAEG